MSSSIGATWSRKPLGDLLETIIDYRGKTPPKSPSGIPALTAANVRDGDLILDKISYVSQETYDRWITRGLLEAGDVLITTEAPVGEVALLPGDQTYLITRRLMALRGRTDDLDNRFLKYSLMYKKNIERLLSSVRGSTVPRVLKTDITGLEIDIPPLPTQRRIAQILGRLDDKIELNRRLNRTLEAMAQALFKHHFVDFGPYQDGEFVESELGLIPKGWKIGQLSDLFVLQRGFDLPKSKRTPGPYPLLAASGSIDTHVEYKAEGPGVTTGRSGQLGTVTYVHDNFWPLNTTLWIKEYRISSPFHAYHHLRTLDLTVFNSGSAVPTLNRNHVHEIKTVVPTMSAIADYDRWVKPYFEMIHAYEKESNKLAEIRDYLLPKLLSGEIAV